MAKEISYEITSEDFREHYTPEGGVDRHWMLDFTPARDLLMLAAERVGAGVQLSLFGHESGDDAVLDLMIDALGLRHEAAPTTVAEQFFASWRYLIKQLRLQLGLESLTSSPP